jgi:Methyltransferase domain
MRLYRRALNYGDPKSWVNRQRARRIGPLLEMIRKVAGARGCVKLLDLGGTAQYWNLPPLSLLRQARVHITVVNLTLENEGAPAWEGIEFLTADACNLSEFADNSFNIVHSNSVIEHLRSWEQMEHFAGEVRRLAPSYFVQTPNYWFPVEPHFLTPGFQWLPEPFRVRLLMRFDLGHHGRKGSIGDAMRAIEGARLLTRAMVAELFPDADILRERFLGLTKSFVAIRRSE